MNETEENLLNGKVKALEELYHGIKHTVTQLEKYTKTKLHDLKDVAMARIKKLEERVEALDLACCRSVTITTDEFNEAISRIDKDIESLWSKVGVLESDKP